MQNYPPGEGYEAVLNALRILSDYCMYGDATADTDVVSAINDLGFELGQQHPAVLDLRDIFTDLRSLQRLSRAFHAGVRSGYVVVGGGQQ